jgi:hypothetical protein
MAIVQLPRLPWVQQQAPSRVQQMAQAEAARFRRYRDYLAFYEGQHFAVQRRGRSNLVINYARAIVDKGVSFLLGRGVNFAVEPIQLARSSATGRLAVAEQGHHQTGAVYFWTDDPEQRVNIWRLEAKARRKGLELQIPDAHVTAALGDGCSELWEFATFWGVAEGTAAERLSLFSGGHWGR